MRIQPVVLSIVTLALIASVAFAQGGTEFTYQGRLLDAGAPANGLFNVDFRLWDDPAAGNQVDVTNTFNSLPILEGLFTVELDFGASAFDNNDRWLEITVDGVPLVPRQPITRTPYAIQTRGIFVDDVGNIGIGTSTPNYGLHVATSTPSYFEQRVSIGFLPQSAMLYVFASDLDARDAIVGVAEGSSNTGVTGHAFSLSGSATGVVGSSISTGGTGVRGIATANSGTTYGGRFENNSTSGRGVYGLATANTGTTYGLYGQSNSGSGRGVYGHAAANAGSTYGVYGSSQSNAGRGLYGLATSVVGTNYGLYAQTNSASGYAGFFKGGHSRFESSASDAVVIENTGTGRGLRSVAPDDTAVWALTTTGFAGVHGANAAASGRGVYGQASDTSGTNYGVYGASSSASGFDFYAGGAGTNYGAASSRRWKGNVVPIGDPLAKLSKLQGVFFDWDEEHGGAHDVGMIAEEVGIVLPEIVQYEQNGVDAIGMDYSKMTPLLVEAVNALQDEKDAQIASLQHEIARVSKRNDALESRLAQLEALMAEVAVRKVAEQ